MSGAYPKPPELQAFEDWARNKMWFKKTQGHFGRNSNDTGYTHWTVNDRANAFLAGVAHAQSLRDSQ